jgi:hypothetical protein
MPTSIRCMRVIWKPIDEKPPVRKPPAHATLRSVPIRGNRMLSFNIADSKVVMCARQSDVTADHASTRETSRMKTHAAAAQHD